MVGVSVPYRVSGYTFLMFWLICLCLPQAYVSGQTMDLPFSNSAFARVDGIKLHYRHWPVPGEERLGSCFLVHGFSASTFSWQEVADSLQQLGYEVVAVDVPPYGYSDKNPRLNQSFTARAGLLMAFLDQEFPGQKWHIAGHSMGGGMVQAMALLYPGAFLSLTLVSATVFEQTKAADRLPFDLMAADPLRLAAGAMAEWFLSFNFERRIRRVLESAYGREPTAEEIRHYAEPLQIPGTALAILSGSAFYMELHDLNASDLAIPGLAIWGGEDSWVPLQEYRQVLEKMPGLELRVIDAAGHNPMETHAGEFMAAWKPFLHSLR